MKPKILPILEIAITEGVRRGYMLAHKHITNPTEESIIERIEECVLSSLYDYFDINEPLD
mgnify:CR=1 FL=1